MPIVRGKGAVLPGPMTEDCPDEKQIMAEMELEDPGISRRGLWEVQGATLGECIRDYARVSAEPVVLSNRAPWLLFERQPFPETPVRVSCEIYRRGKLIRPESFDFAMEATDEIRFTAKVC